MPDQKLLTREEIERIKARAEDVPDYFGIAGSPASWRNAYEVGRQDVPRLITALKRERELLRRAVLRPAYEWTVEVNDYLREVGEMILPERSCLDCCGHAERIAELEAERDDWKATAELGQNESAQVAIIRDLRAEVAALKARQWWVAQVTGVTPVVWVDEKLEAEVAALKAERETLRQKAQDWAGHASLRDGCDCRNEIGQEILHILRVEAN